MALRVLHTPTNVGNHPQGLARAEREIGLDSRCVEIERGWFDYEVDEALAGPGTGAFTLEARRWRLLRRALREYDVVHFNFGRSLMPPAAPSLAGAGVVHVPGRLYARLLWMRDLPLLRRAGKAIAVTFQGDDARQGVGPVVPERHRRLAAGLDGYYTARGDALKRRAIERFERHADRIFFLNPDLGEFLPGRAQFVPYAHARPAERTPGAVDELPEVPVVVHAPSHRGIKGTHHVLEAVARLHAEGVALDFRLVEGLPHADARKEYERAHLLVDQLLVGWYGGLAVELMALGKPVVCFVDRETAERHAPPELVRELPIVHAAPRDLHAVLRELLTTRRGEYAEIARRSRAFVERWHDPVTIARQLRAEYEAALAERAGQRRSSRA
ncbi:MAG: glycosyltransferase [Thermoleophilia bacterium]|nr:glycosyltransferase [Thermoleophilia bacterium]